jgi:hypothetical protein
VKDAVPSPQSKAYFTRSPSGSDDLVEKLYGIPEEPVVGPAGIDGVAGGLFAGAGPVMVTDNTFDQPDSNPLSSVALERTLKVLVDPEGTVQACDVIAADPELTREVSDVLPSPQSKVYFTRSPSGSVARVE